MQVNIMTLTWMGKDKISSLYKSLLPALEGVDWKWFIRDNNSNDGTEEEVASWNNHNIVFFPYYHNLQNYSQGNNWIYYHASVSDPGYILLLNNDIIFQDTQSIKNMITILDNDPKVGVVGCKLNYQGSPDMIQHAGVLFHPSNIGTPYHFRAGMKEEDRDRQNRYYPMVTGAVLLTRASLYGKIKLNEKLNWSWDDSFYCMSVVEQGYDVVYCGQTSVLHAESASLKKNPVNKLFFSQNLRIFTDRWLGKMDKSLVEKYSKDENYAIYRK